MITAWNCERCGAMGRVRHQAHAGVWEVFQDIADAHRRKGEPLGCDTDVSRVRVRIQRKAAKKR